MTNSNASLSERILADFLAPDREPEELNRLRTRASVEQARAEVRYGNIDRGGQLLDRVMSEVHDGTDRLSCALRGVVHSVWGQGMESWGLGEAARDHFTLSIKAFMEASGDDLDLDALRRLVGPRGLTDLGIALGGLDDARAIPLLEMSLASGGITPEGMRRLAELRIQSGNFDGADALVAEALAVIPTDAVCWYLLAEIRERESRTSGQDAYRFAASLSLRRGAFAQALPSLSRLTENDPHDGSAVLATAEVLRQLDETEKAEEIARLGIKLNPNHVEPHLCRAMILMQWDRTADALAELELVLTEHQREPSALLLRGMIRARGDDFEGALHDAEEALEAEPDWPFAFALKGRVLLKLGRLVEAREALGAARAELPDDVELNLEYARVAGRLGEMPEVIDALADIWDSNELQPADVTNLVTALIAVDRLEDAEQVCRRWLARIPEDQPLRRLLGVALAQRAVDEELSGEALKMAAAEAASLAPDEPDVLVIRAVSAREESQVDDAVSMLKRALASDVHHLGAIAELIDVLLERDAEGDVERVEGLARAALEVAPSPTFQVDLATSLGGQGRHREVVALLADDPEEDLDETVRILWFSLRAGSNEALERWSAATNDRATLAELEPEDPSSWFELAESARMAGDQEAAVRAAEQTLKLDPENVLALGTLGVALASLGDIVTARDKLDEAIRKKPDYEWAITERARLANSLEEAKGYLDRLKAIDADEMAFRDARSSVLQSFERYGDALADCMWLLDRDPGNIVVLNRAVTCHLALGQLDAASTRAREALGVEPENVTVLTSLARVDQELGAFPDALEHLEQVRDLDPDSNYTLIELVDVLRNLDRVEESFEILQNLLEREPLDPVVWSAVAHNLLQLGYAEEAIRPFQRSVELNGQDPFTRRELAEALRSSPSRERLELALHECEEANRLVPGRSSGMRNVADVQHELEMGSANALYEKVLAQMERESRSSLRLGWERGWCLFRLGDRERAGRLIFAATSLPLYGPDALMDLMIVTLSRGRDAEAIETCELAISGLRPRGRARRYTLMVAQRDLDVAVRDWNLADHPATERIREILAQARRATPGVEIPASFKPEGA